jgi:hypothetical protein
VKYEPGNSLCGELGVQLQTEGSFPTAIVLVGENDGMVFVLSYFLRYVMFMPIASIGNIFKSNSSGAKIDA